MKLPCSHVLQLFPRRRASHWSQWVAQCVHRQRWISHDSPLRSDVVAIAVRHGRAAALSSLGASHISGSGDNISACDADR